MNIPLNGRIAIVDDKYNEVKPLIEILSKRRIPFNYYSGLKSDQLPENPDENPITLLFLDLNIVETQHNPRVVISTLHPILRALCPRKSKPYFLIMWSKKISDFAVELERHFRTNKELKYRNPVKFVRLSKSDYFDFEDGNYVFNEQKYDLLTTTLTSQLEDISILKNFLTWENIVHSQTAETVGEFSSLYPLNDDWNKNTKAVIYHLAKAMIGGEELKLASDDSKLVIAFSAISSFLADKIQHTLVKNKLGEVSDIIDDLISKKNIDGRLKHGIKGKINSKLHLIEEVSGRDSFEQGNIYKVRYKKSVAKRILDKDQYNNINSDDILSSKPSIIQLDLTPVCDYSQDKKYTRLISGLLIDAQFANMNIRSTYQCQTPIFYIDGKEKFMVLDFRLLTTTSKAELKSKNVAPFLRLRKEICIDIQSQVASQINRPGISKV